MMSSMKIKLLAVIVTISIVAATSYWFISTNTDDNNNQNQTLNFTALDALEYANTYMESKYEQFNLSSTQIKYLNCMSR